MATVANPTFQSFADLYERLGRVPLNRIRANPPPGTATEHDLLEINARGTCLCELVEGVLVEKAVGYHESILAVYIGGLLALYVRPRNLGHVTGEAGMMRLFPGLVRIPDVAYASWDRFPDRRLPEDPIPSLAPDLAIEVLSESNTPAEMAIKLEEYFSASVRVVWCVDLETRTVRVYESVEAFVELREHDMLDGGVMLPGFTISIAEMFHELDRYG